MNCDELRKDIAALKSSRSIMQKKYDHMNKTGISGKADFVESRIATEKLADEILEKYLPDFAEKNPELFNWQPNQEITITDDILTSLSRCENGDILVGSFGSVFKITKNKEGEYGVDMLVDEIEGVMQSSIGGVDYELTIPINTMSSFSEDKIVLGGRETFCLINQDNGNWHLRKKYEQFKNEEGERCSILKILELSNKRVLIGGRKGMLWEYEQDSTGKPIFKQITGFRDDNEELSSIYDMHELPDGSVLICGVRALYRYSKDEDTNEWNLVNEAPNYFHGQTIPIMHNILEISNHRLLIGGWDNDNIYECEIDPDGSLKTIEEFNINKSYDPEADMIYRLEKIFPISDNQILALIEESGEGRYRLYECSKEDDKWALSQEIGEFNKKDDDDENISSNNRISDIVMSPNNSLMIAKYDGSVVEYTRRSSSVEELKDNLDKIIEKGEV